MRNHVVPQFYLREFGEPLSVFDKDTSRAYEAAPRSLAVEKRFYTDPMEKRLAGMESRAAPAVRKILDCKDYYSLDMQEQDRFVEFVAILLLRTSQIRDEIAEIRSDVICDLERLGANTARVTRGREADLDTHEKALVVTSDMVESILKCMHVLVSVNDTGTPLWTSDNPVYAYNDLHPHEGPGLFALVRGATVNVPLSPTLKVGFCDPTTYKLVRSSRMAAENVHRNNHLQALRSTRFVYSRDKFSEEGRSLIKAARNSGPRSCEPAPGASDFQFGHAAGRSARAGSFWAPPRPFREFL